MTITFEHLREQIPYYLAADPKQKVLIENLKQILSGAHKGYYLDAYENEHLQGDGWHGLPLFSFVTGKRREVRGIILSNTCDVAPENIRALPPKISFSPIIKLESLERRFLEYGLSREQVSDKVDAIKKQLTSSLFFLPSCEALGGDYVALLDDVHSVPVEAHDPVDTKKIFTLSMAAFYLFVFKLSIHYCRLHENLER